MSEYKMTLDKITRMVKCFKLVGIKISEFSRKTGIPSSIIYKLSSNPFSNGQLEEIENGLKEYYPEEYQKIKGFIEVTE